MSMTEFAFRLGVVGHRNVAAEHVPDLEAEITRHLQRLSELLSTSYSGASVVSPIPITIVSALAEGADRIFARTALNVLGARAKLVAVLPAPAEDYARDFPGTASEFRDLLALCVEVNVVPPKPSDTREAKYRRSWEMICAQSNLLFALWDLKPGLAAGTAECIRTRCFSAAQTHFGEPYMAGPVVVVPTARSESSAAIAKDPLVVHLERNGWISSDLGPVVGRLNAMEAHKAWLADYAAVALAVGAESAGRGEATSLAQIFAASDAVATTQRQFVNARLKTIAITLYVLMMLFIVVGNVFPIVPVHLLGPAVTVVGVIGWAFMRKHAAHRLFVCARVMAEGVRAQIALNKMGIDRRAVDLLRFRSGPISTTLRELLRSLGPARPERSGDYADCAGWLTEQVQYYTGSAVLRQTQFVRREWIRKQVLVGGGTVILAMVAFAQTIAWLADLTIPRQMTTFVLAFTVAIMMIGVLMGLHTQQMQLRDQGESFARMREVLLTYRDWMQAAGNAQNDHTNQQKSDAAQWVLAQAMAEHEDWCLRHANPVG
jgi:hypothetical protein